MAYINQSNPCFSGSFHNSPKSTTLSKRSTLQINLFSCFFCMTIKPVSRELLSVCGWYSSLFILSFYTQNCHILNQTIGPAGLTDQTAVIFLGSDGTQFSPEVPGIEPGNISIQNIFSISDIYKVHFKPLSILNHFSQVCIILERLPNVANEVALNYCLRLLEMMLARWTCSQQVVLKQKEEVEILVLDSNAAQQEHVCSQIHESSRNIFHPLSCAPSWNRRNLPWLCMPR